MTDRTERRAFLKDAIEVIKQGLATGDGVAVVAVTDEGERFSFKGRFAFRSNAARVGAAIAVLEDIRDDTSCDCEACEANRAVAVKALAGFCDEVAPRVLHS